MSAPDLRRELALLANNAKLEPHVRTEAQRLAVAVDARLLQLENALRTTEAELVTLAPRLSGSYAANVKALLDVVRKALKP